MRIGSWLESASNAALSSSAKTAVGAPVHSRRACCSQISLAARHGHPALSIHRQTQPPVQCCVNLEQPNVRLGSPSPAPRVPSFTRDTSLSITPPPAAAISHDSSAGAGSFFTVAFGIFRNVKGPKIPEVFFVRNGLADQSSESSPPGCRGHRKPLMRKSERRHRNDRAAYRPHYAASEQSQIRKAPLKRQIPHDERPYGGAAHATSSSRRPPLAPASLTPSVDFWSGIAAPGEEHAAKGVFPRATNAEIGLTPLPPSAQGEHSREWALLHSLRIFGRGSSG